MTVFTVLALASTMAILALVPSASVALFVTRSVTHGVKNGAAVSAGIVLGDLVFVSLAVLGLNTVAHSFGSAFVVIKNLGGAYLVWVGIGLLRGKSCIPLPQNDTQPSTLLASFAAGFVLTLGDIKAILFYASLFPVFVEVAILTVTDITLICLITALSVGGVKLIYAFSAQRIAQRFQNQRTQQWAGHASGVTLIGAGTYLIAKS